ncbi:hypothetical protein [Halorubrum sp. SD683]|uniref:hypothetical protein n=1 Tax=Halorubrum sp. SD683 TaxID=1855873 RepID=UPI000A2D670C|nr:hypothetical protein [Halorubrum sp. SD683]OTF01749.1 hypothetical protein B9G49_00355 [Halorubrum sp. SD683]
MTDDTTTDDDASTGWRSVLGLGGVVGLCCLFATPAATGAAGTTVAGGTTAALGGGIIRILVSAVTVGILAVVIGRRTECRSCAE